ncbi:hypothetical protein [Nostoc sp. 2RC]|uniref:hypothetical protein n=1 Tax=Nostoc sp. 2RC TaxID=2485484 RepID=UPI0016289864|nr:hypothetical protein [Nostoc sp. 2RC]MBC1237973.1 hypothetical protein [Nostoc sp. 2RC]
MTNNSNNPREYDAVLGNQQIPVYAAVLGGIEGVKHQLATDAIEHRIAALSKALKYGDKGLNLVIQALYDPEDQLKEEAYRLLKSREEVEIQNILHGFISQHYFIRFDGIYQERDPKGGFYYIKFYPDGTVITASSTSDNTQQVAKWFFKENHRSFISKGTYTVENENLQFPGTCNNGKVDYWGKILIHSNSLCLQWYSHINGRSGDSMYNFIQLDYF